MYNTRKVANMAFNFKSSPALSQVIESHFHRHYGGSIGRSMAHSHSAICSEPAGKCFPMHPPHCIYFIVGKARVPT